MKADWNFWTRILRAPEGEGTGGGDAGGSAGTDSDGSSQSSGSGDGSTGSGANADDTGGTPAGDQGQGQGQVQNQEQMVPVSVFQKRLSQVTAAKARAEAEAAELRTKMAQGTTPSAGEQIQGQNQNQGQTRTLTDADVERRANELAELRAFNERANRVVEQGKTTAQDFLPTLDSLKTLAGGQLPKTFIENVLEIDAPHEVLYALGKDTTKAMEILDLPPNKQAIALAKFEVELKGKKTTQGTKPVTKAPAPIEPQIGGAGGRAAGAVDLADPNTDISAWMEARKKSLADRRARR